jgi:5-formyltetrahydrofolate cyclo-ligase
VPLAEIDLYILPGLAFDARGARLGWGRGHFDATLAATPRALRLAWAYEFQVVAAVPEGPGDERVDVIVTETSVHLTGARPLPLPAQAPASSPGRQSS